MDDIAWAFPTPVGMNRVTTIRLLARHRVPHTRGDEPAENAAALAEFKRSPHPWG